MGFWVDVVGMVGGDETLSWAGLLVLVGMMMTTDD